VLHTIRLAVLAVLAVGLVVLLLPLQEGRGIRQVQAQAKEITVGMVELALVAVVVAAVLVL
jgi:hypothetical protein